MSDIVHVPVLGEEILKLFSARPGDMLLDATLGQGGHAQMYLEATAGSGTVVGIDADPKALAVAQKRLAKYGQRVQYVVANFSQLNDALKRGGMVEEGDSSFKKMSPQHILFDLGIGSHQVADPERGFSFARGGPLTMAYGKLAKLPSALLPALNALEGHLGRLPDAADILQNLAETDLGELIKFYGEERYAKRVAQAIKRRLPIATAAQLSEIVRQALPAGYERGRLHPATRTFQALRLAVNRELEALASALPQALELLLPQGVLAVISFHSLEDRIVKQFFRSRKGELEILTKKPIRASEAEVKRNPRARSAKLRAARKK